MTTTITINHVISMGHRLPTYKGDCSSPHGHNAKFEVEIETSGVFIDFKTCTNVLKRELSPLDHAMVLKRDDPLILPLRECNFRVFDMITSPTTENIAEWLFKRLTAITDWKVVRVTVHETDKYSATVRV